MDIVSVQNELEKYPEGTFADLLKFNTGHFSACSISGASPVWEMHPDTDEFFYLVAGDLSIELREPDRIKTYHASAGDMFVVPRGVWHKPAAPNGVKFLYFTPGKSLHSEEKDPLNPKLS